MLKLVARAKIPKCTKALYDYQLLTTINCSWDLSSKGTIIFRSSRWASGLVQHRKSKQLIIDILYQR